MNNKAIDFFSFLYEFIPSEDYVTHILIVFKQKQNSHIFAYESKHMI